MGKYRIKAKKRILGMPKGFFSPDVVLLEPGEVFIYDDGRRFSRAAGEPFWDDVYKKMEERLGAKPNVSSNWKEYFDWTAAD